MHLNIDINSTIIPYFRDLLKKDKITVEDFYPFIDEFDNTTVTDIYLNIFAQSSATETKYFDTWADKYERKTENGIPVDYTNEMNCYTYYRITRTHGFDPFKIWIDRTRELGMNPWLSIRMNDCHCPDEETIWIRDRHFYRDRERGLMNGDRYGYYRYTLNYRYEEIRQRFLNYIEEQLAKYDPYGLELDFMREIYCFDYVNDNHDECVEIMNSFIRSVKKIVTAAEEKWGHKIKIAVRLTRDLEKSLRYCFDAKAWAREGLVDVIIPSPRFRGSDSHIPIEEWKRELPGVEIYACIETLMNVLHSRHPVLSVDVARGLAASYLARGADGIYTYNWFGEGHKERDKKFQRTCYSVHSKLVKLPMRFVIIDEDDDIVPEGLERWQQLPIIPSPEKTVEFVTGELNPKTVKTLIISFDEGTPDDVTVELNGKKISLVPCDAPDPTASTYTDGARHYGTIIETSPHTQRVTVKKKTDAKVVISWVEISVSHKI